ncbi:SGNH/GDSL hydrolase family protein [Arthrobacter sp. CJ23]|uniref:SGNH/GDSL hydrolase family protein n=1 Tax=Arthrobacter sp. CJ23 TaxID=2972479 RepID=UPI00215BB655|nr:SGNH/GDSL hydrolase family protein [Arthrobacter sp. CJ23]UVJ39314.1 SGNH/GDSL hydrolase family protein [Arthrobacter sp. CJ23]
MDFSARYVALGDSFTEGVGDDDAARPNGVRGWADLTAAELARSNEGFGYANLAIRGRKLRQIMAEQVDAAVELKPTLVTLYAGANDILRPKVDIDSLVEEYDAGIAKLSATGATVVLFTGFDSRNSKVFATTRGRTAIYNELVREVAERHGALLVDYWRFGEYNDPRMWAEDRMHMSTAGHVNMAKRVLAVLDQDDAIEVPALASQPEPGRAEALRANARWVREFAGPWVVRRVRRRSSGDGLRPKYATLTRPLSLPVIP